MEFPELLEQLKTLKREEMRSQAADYFEIVVASTEMPSLLSMLQDYFGEPLKPVGKSPSNEAQRCAKPYGGVRENQTLFYRRIGEGSVVALIWPWGSGLSLTLKLFRENNGRP